MMRPTPVVEGAICAEPLRAGRFGQAVRAVVHWVTDARSHRVMILVAGLWLLNAFDLVFTITAFRQRFLYELNPVALHVLARGEIFLVLYKFGLMAIGSYPLLKFRRERVAEMGATLILIVYALVAVHWQDCYEVYAQTDLTTADTAQLDPLAHVTQE